VCTRCFKLTVIFHTLQSDDEHDDARVPDLTPHVFPHLVVSAFRLQCLDLDYV
jgi:hypothetical protein